jgi:hypothetical protein
MSRHTAGYYSSVNLAALTLLNAIPDTQLYTNSTNIRVDPTVDMLASVYNNYIGGTTFTQSQITTPSLRALAPIDVSENNLALPTTVSPSLLDLYASPKQLDGNESMTLGFNGSAGGVEPAYSVVDFVDGPIKPVGGNIFTVRATGAATLAAGTWVNTAVTFGTVLPAGNYIGVGMRAEGANLVAARAVFVGSTYRPGCPGVTAPKTPDYFQYRYGNLGVWGTFNINQPPTVDCLGATDTTQVFYFDLIQTTTQAGI